MFAKDAQLKRAVEAQAKLKETNDFLKERNDQLLKEASAPPPAQKESQLSALQR